VLLVGDSLFPLIDCCALLVARPGLDLRPAAEGAAALAAACAVCLLVSFAAFRIQATVCLYGIVS